MSGWYIVACAAGGVVTLLLLLGVASYRSTQTWADRILPLVPFETTNPISVRHLMEALEEQGFNPLGASIYVALEVLEEEGWIKRVERGHRSFWHRVRPGGRERGRGGWKMPPVATEVPA